MQPASSTTRRGRPPGSMRPPPRLARRRLEVPVAVRGVEDHAARIVHDPPGVQAAVVPAVAVGVAEQDLAGVLLTVRTALGAVRAHLQHAAAGGGPGPAAAR